MDRASLGCLGQTTSAGAWRRDVLSSLSISRHSLLWIGSHSRW